MIYYISGVLFLSGIYLVGKYYFSNENSIIYDREIEKLEENVFELKTDLESMIRSEESFEILKADNKKRLKEKFDTFKSDFKNEFDKPFDIEILNIDRTDNLYFLYCKYWTVKLEKDIDKKIYFQCKKEFEKNKNKIEKIKAERYLYRNNS